MATKDPLFQPPSKLARVSSEEATNSLLKNLKASRDNLHCFINSARYHNHVDHHLYAAYRLGATPAILDKIYEVNAQAALPLVSSAPRHIDQENWKDHLGRRSYYAAYLDFFSRELLQRGLDQFLDYFIFSYDANWGSGAPQMFNRLVSGMLHPLIQLGHATDSGILGLSASALAQAAVHINSSTGLFPPPFFDCNTSLNQKSPPVHAFTIVQKVFEDCSLATQEQLPRGTGKEYLLTLKSQGDQLYEHVKTWQADDHDINDLIEQIVFLAVLIYGVGGWKPNEPFSADLYTVHPVNTAIFLPSVLPHFSPSCQRKLLRAVVSVSLAFWVARGRPLLQIREFMAGTNPRPRPPCFENGSKSSGQTNTTDDLWLPILNSDVVQSEVHLLKLQRSLAHYANIYGSKPKGYFAGTGLEGAEELDGSIFIRVAGLSMEYFGWVPDETSEIDWSM